MRWLSLLLTVPMPPGDRVGMRLGGAGRGCLRAAAPAAVLVSGPAAPGAPS